MKSNYKPLSELVERIDVRNSGCQITDLVGLSIDKCFIRSVANTIGTDLSKYKVISKNEFAVSLMQVSRDSKIPVACMKEYDVAIMSPAYSIFRIKDESVILPDYLDMWFKRPEFDREAAFIAVGGVRGSMPWDDFARMKIMVPDIRRQREIVNEYEVITNRIALKEQINDNLEAQLSTLFIEYIINDASFEFDEALDDNIEFINGLAMQNFRPDDNQLSLPVIKIRELSQGFCDDNSELCKESIGEDHIINVGDIVFSWSGTLQVSFWTAQQAGLNQHLFKVTSSKYPEWFIYLWITYYLFSFQRIAKNKGTTFGHIKREDLHNSKIKSLNHKRIIELNNVFSPIINLKIENACEKQSLIEVQTSLLAKLGC